MVMKLNCSRCTVNEFATQCAVNASRNGYNRPQNLDDTIFFTDWALTHSDKAPALKTLRKVHLIESSQDLVSSRCRSTLNTFSPHPHSGTIKEKRFNEL